MGMPPATITQDASGRITGTKGLTNKESEFVRVYVANGGRGVEAATAAGYESPQTECWRLLRRPHIANAIHKARQRRIGEIATAGLDLLARVINGTEPATPKTRVSAAQFVIGLAGHVAPKAIENGDKPDKPLEEMTVSELESLIRRLDEAARLARQPVIDGSIAPAVAPPAGQLTDITPEDAA